MRASLKDKAMDLPVFCSVYGLEDKSTENAILYCSKARLILTMEGNQPWEESDGSWLSPFLDVIW